MSRLVQTKQNIFHWGASMFIPLIVFAVFLGIGLTVYDDYGLSIDEGIRLKMGTLVYRFIFKGDRTLFEQKENFLYHGLAYGFFLAFLAEDIFDFSDPYDIFLMRHLVNFLIFYASVLFFYLLCQERFQNWKLSLLGSVLLFTHPRIFAHAFYNPKDLPFLSFFVISTYTLVKFLKNPSWLRAAIHAVLCAILVNFRVVGMILPGLTILFTAIILLTSQKDKKRLPHVYALVLYGCLLIGMLFALTPTAWEHPLEWGKQVLNMTQKFPWEGTMLYMGNMITGDEVPWHYIPVWFLVTTPLLYSGVFFLGFISFFTSFLRKSSEYHQRNTFYQKIIDIICFVLVSVPMGMVIILKPVVYNGWRHLFFLYPFVVFFCLHGAWFGISFIGKKWKSEYRTGHKILEVVGLVLILLEPVSFMIRYHPHQQVYFNRLAGPDMASIKTRFDLDYWGLTYRTGLQYILRHDQRQTIRIHAAGWIGEYTGTHIFRREDRERLKFGNAPEEADYFIGNFYRHPQPYPYQHNFFSLRIGNADVLVVYKIAKNRQ